MDNKLSVHRKRSPKQPKTKKKPIKVVYISNPMKVETSVSQFRALVQELTGRDSNSIKLSSLHPDLSKFNDTDAADEKPKSPTRRMEDDPSNSVQVTVPIREASCESSCLFDDVFTYQMMESLAGYCLPIL